MHAWIAVVWFALAFGSHFKFGHLFSEAQQLQRGEYQHVNYAYFQNFFHQMLNISQVLASYYATDDMDCAFKCLAKMSCFSFNFATLAADSNSGRHLCELLASDKYNHANSFVPSRDFHHFAIRSPCVSLPCQNGGTCRPLYDTNSYVCQCAEGNNGTFCENGWQKVNVDPVCFGAKDDSFGTFAIHKPGNIYRLKLVHHSGFVNCISDSASATKWGCSSSPFAKKVNVHITDENNNRVFPTAGSVRFDSYYFYELPGFDENSAEIVLDFFPAPLSVAAGQKFRIWYGEDLMKSGEGNNVGKSCVDVYGFY